MKRRAAPSAAVLAAVDKLYRPLEPVMTQHKNIYAALAAAQMEMGAALKSSNNPAFRSKYADLASVVDACGEALNRHGIAFYSHAVEAHGQSYLRTVLTHGESETSIDCDVPLILGKRDMQGYGSAVTYARRYGLMALAGIAPEDDDGNAAAKNAPRPDNRRPEPPAEPYIAHHANRDFETDDGVIGVKGSPPAPAGADGRAKARHAADQMMLRMNERPTAEGVRGVWNRNQAIREVLDAEYPEILAEVAEHMSRRILQLEGGAEPEAA